MFESSQELADEEFKTDDDIDKHLIKYISTKKHPKPENVLNILDKIYKYIVYKIIVEVQKNVDEVSTNCEIPIEYIFNNEQIEEETLEDNFLEPNCFNFNHIKIKNIFHLWKIFVKIHLKNRNL